MLPGALRLEPIGTVESCFKEKFGIPRQPGLLQTPATIRLPLARFRDAVEGLEQSSHLWVIFLFHESLDSSGRPEWKPRVRPPRLGGARKIGVFASRSPHRPNPIGISVVRLERIERSKKELLIHVLGADLLDGTPVLDLKPYVPYADSIPRARSPWARPDRRRALRVSFSREAIRVLRQADHDGKRRLRPLIAGMIAQDPRPAFQRGKAGTESYAFRFAEFDVHWNISGERARVTGLSQEAWRE